MTNFDMDEKIISDAINELNANLITPDLMTGIRNKLDGSNAVKEKRKPKKLIVAAAAVVALLAFTTTAAASLGIFDWFREKTEPKFGDIIEPAEPVSATCSGMKFTVAAAGASGDSAVIYITAEDTENRGRVQPDSFLEITASSGASANSWGGHYSLSYFDKETGIGVFQIMLTRDGSFDGQTISLNIDGICYGMHQIEEGGLVMDLDLAEAAAQGEHKGEPAYKPTNNDSFTGLTAGGYLMDIPDTNGSWLSAVGINCGYLTIQYTKPTCGVSYSSGANITPYLVAPNGNVIYEFSNNIYTADPQFNYLDSSHKYEEGEYCVQEGYFKVDTENLEGYRLGFKGYVCNLVTGEWNLDVEFDNVPQNTLEVRADVDIGDLHLKDTLIQLSPVSLKFSGTGTYDPFGCGLSIESHIIDPPNVIIETTEGNFIPSGGSH